MLGLFPANRVGDDIEVYTDESRTEVKTVLRGLRQQTDKVSQARDGNIFPNYCLSDFVAPKESGVPDWIGAFAVSGGFGEAKLAEDYKAAGDDYHAILVQSVCDRLAEAFAEYRNNFV